jgi:hypothetical protein
LISFKGQSKGGILAKATEYIQELTLGLNQFYYKFFILFIIYFFRKRADE